MAKHTSNKTDVDFIINKSNNSEKTDLARMYFTLVMDRPVDKARHYISPGGYIITSKNLDVMRQFDFMTSYGTIDEDNPSCVYFELRDFDYEFSANSDSFDLRFLDSWEFKEFYIYTGEDLDEEINPIRIENLLFSDKEGRLYKAPESVLESANRTLAHN